MRVKAGISRRDRDCGFVRNFADADVAALKLCLQKLDV